MTHSFSPSTINFNSAQRPNNHPLNAHHKNAPTTTPGVMRYYEHKVLEYIVHKAQSAVKTQHDHTNERGL